MTVCRAVSIPINEEGRASRAPAEYCNQDQRYHWPIQTSSGNPLEAAAQTLLRLQHVAATEQPIFWRMFERRLRRVYDEGVKP